jgi:predicted alpha/beta superfamily hydrolase
MNRLGTCSVLARAGLILRQVDISVLKIGRRLSRVLSATLVIAVMANAPMSAQGPVNPPLWTKDSIRSTILGETRVLQISLPVEYEAPGLAGVRYPVLIMLDAQADPFFTASVATVRALELSGPPMIPPLIIVGVETPAETSRIRDMTPPIYKEVLNNDRAGGAPAFLKFLSTELWPLITTRYRALPVVVIWGHSLSGLFTAWAFGQQPDFIRGAIASSPSLYFANTTAARAIVDDVATRTAPGRLFVETGTFETAGMVRGAESFVAQLKSRLPSGVVVEYHGIEEAQHSHAAVLGFIPGLRFVFHPVSLSGYEVPRLFDIGAPNPTLIAAFDSTRDRYVRGARQLGMPQRLPFVFLRNQSRAYQDSSRTPLRLHICQELTTSYPEYWGGHACTGDAQATLGRLGEAVASYRRASEVARRSSDIAIADSLARKADSLRPPQ